jgi:hypothetical protein
MYDPSPTVATTVRPGSASFAPSAAGSPQPSPPECGASNHERCSRRSIGPRTVPNSLKTVDSRPDSASETQRETNPRLIPFAVCAPAAAVILARSFSPA